jgi:hypothetical protein
MIFLGPLKGKTPMEEILMVGNILEKSTCLLGVWYFLLLHIIACESLKYQYKCLHSFLYVHFCILGQIFASLSSKYFAFLGHYQNLVYYTRPVPETISYFPKRTHPTNTLSLIPTKESLLRQTKEEVWPPICRNIYKHIVERKLHEIMSITRTQHAIIIWLG